MIRRAEERRVALASDDTGGPPASPRATVDPGVGATVERLYRERSRHVLATLIRLVGDFDLAEEALHDAFAAALERWPRDGVPERPLPWLVSAGRFRAIDRLRRRARFERAVPDAAVAADALAAENGFAAARAENTSRHDVFDDDLLRLVFTCCHPALAPDARVALTLREVCGLATEAIAHAFLVRPATIAQRIVRAKARIRAAGLPYEVPGPAALPERFASVSRVVYLVFNEGYLASSGEDATRADLAAEAIALARTLVALLDAPEARGLLALLLLHESRRAARTDAAGDIVPLEEQDRGRWDTALIAEGDALVREALASRPVGPYALQAAIAAVHATTATSTATDWGEIVGLYDLLLAAEPSAVVALNRAAAIAMRDGPDAGLKLIDALLADGALDAYHVAHAARADLCRRLGRRDEARTGYRRALALTALEPERRLLVRRLGELDAVA